MDEELQQLNSGYNSQLQQLNTKTKAIIAYFLLYVSKNVLQGDYDQTKYKLLTVATTTLKTSIVKLIQDNMQLALETSQQITDIYLKYFQNEVEAVLNSKNTDKTAKMASLAGIMVKMSDSDKQNAINAIVNKKWPDGLVVIDRINLLGNKIKKFTENTIIQSNIMGLSPEEVAATLKSRFIDGGIEQRAMLRLSTHTVNMVKEKAFADIATKSDSIIGIHIMRSPTGSVKCMICAEHAGEVGGNGVKYMKENGDIDIMAEMPPYHSRCLCYEVPIFEDADTFIKNAEKEFASGENKEYTTNKWVDANGKIKWPDNDGFQDNPVKTVLQPGMLIDRYGDEKGSFVSPKGTPYKMRSLSPGSETKAYHVYEILKSIEVLSGETAAWFDNPGGGTQHKFSKRIKDLLKEGYISEVK